MFLHQFQTGCLSHFAYYIESEGKAVIIDPLREFEPYLDFLKERGAELVYVLETHFHADFVSGHLDLAKQTGAQIVFGAKAKPHYPAYLAQDHETLSLGALKIEVLPTPGHTIESVSYLLYDESGKKHAVFTGDAVFVGDVGRPDLSSGDLSREALASMLYDTIQNVFKKLPDDVLLYPAHGQGSACGKKLGPESFSTLGDQKKTNYAFRDMPREEFVKEVTEGLPTPPAYFFKDAAINIDGYQSFDELLKQNSRSLSVDEFKALLQDEKVLLLDTRDAADYEAGYIPGSLNLGLNGKFAPWVGALIPFDTQILLITEEGKEEEAVTRLARVGYEKVSGFLQGGVEAWKAAGNTLEKMDGVSRAEVDEFLKNAAVQILDVRTLAEYEESHYDHALNIPLADLPARKAELDPSVPYLVHCGGGYRSMAAASLLKAAGFHNITNLRDGYNGMCQLKKS